jgi:hypothetical protein
MTTKKKIIHGDEIDLIEIIIILMKNKMKIFLVTFLFLILMIGYQNIIVKETYKINYQVYTQISPISVFDEFDYQIYNSYLANTGSIILQYPIKMKNETFILNEVTMDLEDAPFEKIDRKYLIDLFTQKINDKKFLFKIIDEFGIIDKKDYKNNSEYKDAILEFASSFRLLPIDTKNMNNENRFVLNDGWSISFLSYQNDLKKFLTYLELRTNLEIKKYLKEKFEKLILVQKNIKKYNLQDISFELSNTNDESYIRKLNIQKEKLIRQKDIERITKSFNTTPIINSKKFAAAKILSDNISYKIYNKKPASKRIMIIISGVFGLIFGILYVLISAAIKRRR